MRSFQFRYSGSFFIFHSNIPVFETQDNESIFRVSSKCSKFIWYLLPEDLLFTWFFDVRCSEANLAWKLWTVFAWALHLRTRQISYSFMNQRKVHMLTPADWSNILFENYYEITVWKADIHSSVSTPCQLAKVSIWQCFERRVIARIVLWRDKRLQTGQFEVVTELGHVSEAGYVAAAQLCPRPP